MPRLWVGLAALFVLMIGLAGCGEDDTSAVESCSFHSDCPVGTSCNYEGKCIEAACSNCENEPSLVCLVTDEHPEGVCSVPECSSDGDCAEGESCQEGLCTDGSTVGDCQSDADCADGEKCNLANECVPDDSTGCTTSDDCGDGEYCDQDAGSCAVGDCYDSTDCADSETCDTNNTCVPDGTDPCGGCPQGQTCNTQTSQCEVTGTEPCGGSCPSGQVCNTQTDQCEPEQNCDPACTDGQICDTTSGTCIDNNCPPGTPEPSDCAADPVYNKFDADGCFCAQCLSDSDCDTGAGETCNPNGECIVCNESCDPSQGGNACSDPGFYCVSNCCIECVGNSDCPQGEVCVDGSCGAPPDCSVDPSACTGGMVCNQSTGQCEMPQSGTSCSSDADCQQGQFCDPSTQTCQSLIGDGSGMTCDPQCPSGPDACIFGMMCTCPQDAMPWEQVCPSGQVCLIGVCIAL
ncbi:hypothetical protein FIV42_24290 [Persicimonas caeni]|uniref:Uncharacterized protein n=1 Tax=Persicimonas caeni TaxID=2292766 RepID=A0A4Y6PZJ5_PERCE|nr:hypothetical protein [Persicimonas caeni]QDG53748.1 hypothetical protein FIV42_24290 [Persicimonas caeni]QED34969.1 hypothetical protein FRD00_24285 [Persicimonas caeni]